MFRRAYEDWETYCMKFTSSEVDIYIMQDLFLVWQQSTHLTATIFKIVHWNWFECTCSRLYYVM
jgi:hypothetical protein